MSGVLFLGMDAVDLGAMYRAGRLRIGELVDDGGAATPVPATELWDVHDVLAHLAGALEDVATGNMTDAPSDAWSAAQVERGRGLSVGQLLDRWAEYSVGIETFLSSPNGSAASAVVMDVNSHEADLRNALGLACAPDAEFTSWAGPSLMTSFTNAVEANGLAPVTVEVEPFEVLRGRMGRRTADEVAGYGWSADPTPYFDTWFIFGRRSESLGERRSPAPS